MTPTDTTARQRRPFRTGVGLLLYFLAITLTPLMHAQTEREFGAASFEATHSAQCLPLHDEAVCPTCGAHSTLADAPPTTRGLLAPTHTLIVPLAPPTVPPSPAPSPLAARAPPQL